MCTCSRHLFFYGLSGRVHPCHPAQAVALALAVVASARPALLWLLIKHEQPLNCR